MMKDVLGFWSNSVKRCHAGINVYNPIIQFTIHTAECPYAVLRFLRDVIVY